MKNEFDDKNYRQQYVCKYEGSDIENTADLFDRFDQFQHFSCQV